MKPGDTIQTAGGYQHRVMRIREDGWLVAAELSGRGGIFNWNPEFVTLVAAVESPWVRETNEDYPDCIQFALRNAKIPIDQVRVELHGRKCRKNTGSEAGWRFRWPEMQIFKPLEATSSVEALEEATTFLRAYFEDILKALGGHDGK